MSGQRFAGVCILLLASAVGAGLGVVLLQDVEQPPGVDVLLVASGPEAYRHAVTRGAEAAAKELGVSLTVQHGDASKASYREAIFNSDATDVVRGVVLCRAPFCQTDLPAERVGEHTRLVTCGEDAGPTHRLCHVGTDHFVAGRVAARLVTNAMPSGGRTVAIVDVADEIGAERLAGFRHAMREVGSIGGKYAIAKCLIDESQADLRGEEVRKSMKTNIDVVCVIDFSESPSSSDVPAFASVARERAARFVTFEGGAEALAGVESGDVFAVMANNPYLESYRAVLELTKLCRGSELGLPARGRGSVNVPVSVVQQGSVAEFRAQMLAVDQKPAA